MPSSRFSGFLQVFISQASRMRRLRQLALVRRILAASQETVWPERKQCSAKAGSTICVPSATRHNIHLYPYFLFAAIHHLKSSPTFSVRPCGSVGRVTVDLIRRSWVRFPPRSKDFFFASCGSLFPFIRANAQWVIHGFKVAL